MAIKTYKCNVHGGLFKRESRRGRPPTRCTDDNPCSRVHATEVVETPSVGEQPMTRDELISCTPKELRAHARKMGYSSITRLEGKRQLVDALMAQYAKAEPTVSATPSQVKHIANRASNPSLTKAMAAKKQLEPLGWSVKGRAYQDDGAACAEIQAIRGAEFLLIVWQNGEFVTQDYRLWDASSAAKLDDGGKRKLAYDPTTLTDEELVAEVRGRKVTWYNRLSNGTEAAIVPTKLSIERVFGEGISDRIVKFCARDGGFRAFHVSAVIDIQ